MRRKKPAPSQSCCETGELCRLLTSVLTQKLPIPVLFRLVVLVLELGLEVAASSPAQAPFIDSGGVLRRGWAPVTAYPAKTAVRCEPSTIDGESTLEGRGQAA